MKKQFPFWAKCLLVVAVLAAGYFWYTRPMTLEQICPSFRWAETGIMASNSWAAL